MALTLHCECGQVQGVVEPGEAYVRATCYCTDCQAYARWLDTTGLTDAQGGTDIVAMNPAAVRFTAGQDHIACMSLSDKGLLRWYASCCRTPLGNTPRDGKTPYVGMVGIALGPAQAVDQAYGPAGRVVINTGSAKGEVKKTPLGFIRGGIRILGGILRARLSGQKPTLFFDAEARPIRTPQVIAVAPHGDS
jgi:hypothetical protein